MSMHLEPNQITSEATEGRLLSRPGKIENRSTKGMKQIGSGACRSVLYVPETADLTRPVPFVLSFHGAGGNERHGLDLLREQADAKGFILLAPQSRGQTWDVIVEDYGLDVSCIDQGLKYVFTRYDIDTDRLAIGGFSDGASYALSLGVSNGDLFSHVIAFSPGFMMPKSKRGSPAIFISHGTEDQVLPIQRCSRQIAPRLLGSGYRVRYDEFEGGHSIPEKIRANAIEWLLNTKVQKPIGKP